MWKTINGITKIAGKNKVIAEPENIANICNNFCNEIGTTQTRKLPESIGKYLSNLLNPKIAPNSNSKIFRRSTC